MKNTSNISGTGNQSGQVNTTPRETNPVSIVSLLVLGAVFIVLVALTIALYKEFIATGEYGIPAYFLGMLATAVFILLSALLASRFRTEKAKPAQHKVRAALISALRDEDPKVRYAAAKGLAELDLEESVEHFKHDDLDTILVSALADDDPDVRSEAVEGLAVVEMEKYSYQHAHDRLDGTLLKHNIP
jgi:hypothetical protein